MKLSLTKDIKPEGLQSSTPGDFPHTLPHAGCLSATC